MARRLRSGGLFYILKSRFALNSAAKRLFCLLCLVKKNRLDLKKNRIYNAAEFF